MELITIRGKKDGGKTTTAAMTNNILVYKYGAKTIGLWLDKRLAPVNGDNGETHDFHSVLELNGKVVVFISAGDDSIYLETEIQKMRERFSPLIMVVCVRFRDDNYTMRMLQKEYNNLYQHRKDFILRYTDDSTTGKKDVASKKEVSEECAKYIVQHINDSLTLKAK